jgi:hypothetical protein
MGNPHLTVDALAKALEECRLAGLENPGSGDALKEHIDWIKYRIREQAEEFQGRT